MLSGGPQQCSEAVTLVGGQGRRGVHDGTDVLGEAFRREVAGCVDRGWVVGAAVPGE